MRDPRDEAFVLLLDAVRRFNSSPSPVKRDNVETAAKRLVEIYDEMDTQIEGIGG